jgi:PAS domain-containing protein
MHKHGAQSSTQARLRVSAEARLESGTAPPTQGGPAGTPALSLLHEMASVPASASNALKLLHELQVHQIELDLQQEQADQERQHLSAAQARVFDLFNLAPFAYLTVDGQGQVVDANLLASAWMQAGANGPVGQNILSLLTPDCRPALQEALLRLHHGSEGEQFNARALSGLREQQMRATTDGQLIMIAWMPVAPALCS